MGEIKLRLLVYRDGRPTPQEVPVEHSKITVDGNITPIEEKIARLAFQKFKDQGVVDGRLQANDRVDDNFFIIDREEPALVNIQQEGLTKPQSGLSTLAQKMQSLLPAFAKRLRGSDTPPSIEGGEGVDERKKHTIKTIEGLQCPEGAGLSFAGQFLGYEEEEPGILYVLDRESNQWRLLNPDPKIDEEVGRRVGQDGKVVSAPTTSQSGVASVSTASGVAAVSSNTSVGQPPADKGDKKVRWSPFQRKVSGE